jgi:drug/metabolite transporter (DMT)-like permease
MSSFAYYVSLILSLRYATPAICALILGISPITTSFYGNWKEKECSFRSLILPAVLIVIGLVIINAPHIAGTESPGSYILGLFCALWALWTWTWYVVANSRFLKSNTEVSSGAWSTLLGVSTFFWVFVFGLIFQLLPGGFFEIGKFTSAHPDILPFLAGSMILGLLCSWVGAYLWNRACSNLPVSLSGQLTIFETIFGVLFVYAVEQRLPPVWECLGMAFLFAAIIYGIRQSAKNSAVLAHPQE